MRKSVLMALFAFGLSGTAMAYDADQEELEICVTSGQCALRVHAEELEGNVYLAKRKDLKVLRSLWQNAAFYEVDEIDYNLVRAWLPKDTLVLPAVVPDEDQTMATTPRPTPAPIQGPLIGGSITVTVGAGGSGCGDCHKGNMSEIHKQVMKPRN